MTTLIAVLPTTTRVAQPSDDTGNMSADLFASDSQIRERNERFLVSWDATIHLPEEQVAVWNPAQVSSAASLGWVNLNVSEPGLTPVASEPALEATEQEPATSQTGGSFRLVPPDGPPIDLPFADETSENEASGIALTSRAIVSVVVRPESMPSPLEFHVEPGQPFASVDVHGAAAEAASDGLAVLEAPRSAQLTEARRSNSTSETNIGEPKLGGAEENVVAGKYDVSDLPREHTLQKQSEAEQYPALMAAHHLLPVLTQSPGFIASAVLGRVFHDFAENGPTSFDLPTRTPFAAETNLPVSVTAAPVAEFVSFLTNLPAETDLLVDPDLLLQSHLPSAQAAVSGSPPHPATPFPALVVQVLHGLNMRQGSVTEIALAPEELGRVVVTLKAHDADPERITVMMTFDRPEAMDLFRRNADQLLTELRSAGFSAADLNFAQSGAGHQDDNKPPPSQQSGARSELTEMVAAGMPSGALPPSGLDLRL